MQLEAKDSALVLIDLQKGVLAMPVAPHSAAAVYERSKRFAERFRSAGGCVVWVRVSFSGNFADALRQPVDRPIASRGPTAYWSSLPIKAIVAALRRKKIPAAVSQTAGTFVCNHVFYALMHELRRRPAVRGGFIHVPLLPKQAKGRPSLPFAVMIAAVELAVRTALSTRRDVRVAGGREN